jgi:hypothetical protein
MTTSYSEKELADIALIKKICLLTPGSADYIIQKFNDPATLNITTPFSIDPPSGRCSDGKRRGVLDYLDFLFPDPDIEDLIAASNTPDRVFVTTFDHSNPRCWNVIFTRT